MQKKSGLSNSVLTCRYWQAVVAFGENAVRDVLYQSIWADKYPELIQTIKQGNDQGRVKIILPTEIVREIARSKKCENEFYADPDGLRLYGVPIKVRCAEPSSVEAAGFRKVPIHEALERYGAYCLFKACDSSYGYKGERDQLR